MPKKLWAYLDNKPVTVLVKSAHKSELNSGDQVFCDNQVFAATPDYIKSGGECYQFLGKEWNHQKFERKGARTA